MGAATGLRLAIDYPEKVDQLVCASGAYDFQGWQPAFRRLIPQLTVEGIPRALRTRFEWARRAGPCQINTGSAKPNSKVSSHASLALMAGRVSMIAG